MGIYLIERYLPGLGPDEIQSLALRLEAATTELEARGIGVRYLGSTYVPEEESCFCRIEAPSVEAVVRLNELADAPYARINPALALGEQTADGCAR